MRKPYVAFPAAEPDTDHPSAETRPLCETDALLRRNGYVIHSRPNGAEATWSLGVWREGVPVYTQTVALQRVESPESRA